NTLLSGLITRSTADAAQRGRPSGIEFPALIRLVHHGSFAFPGQEGASMISRRRFVGHLGCIAAVGQLAGEAFLARRAWAGAAPRDDMVWLDANENPAGPPLSAIKAIVDGAAATARYHFDEFAAFADAIARSESLTPEQVVFGIGSSDVIDAAICAFTSSSKP